MGARAMNPLAILAHWKLIVLGLAIAAAGIQTWRLDRAQSKLAIIAAEGRAAEQRKKQIEKTQDEITRRLYAADEQRELERERELANLRRQLRDARSSLMSGLPDAPGSGDGVSAGSPVICFARERLREGLDGAMAAAEERVAELVERGALAIDVLETCATWAVEQQRANGGP